VGASLRSWLPGIIPSTLLLDLPVVIGDLIDHANGLVAFDSPRMKVSSKNV
jgi:hypothetical protein